jgi:hypothetical protein
MIARTWRLRKQATRAIDQVEAGDFAGAEAEFTAALEADLPPRARAIAQHNLAYLERRQGRVAPAIARLSDIARAFPELRVIVSTELAVCYALTGSGAAKVFLPHEGADTASRALVQSRHEKWDDVLDLRPPRLLPWCESLYRHERRLLPLFQLFAEEQAGEPPPADGADLRAEFTPVSAREFSYLGASWPAMAAFLGRHDLAPR